MADQTTIKVPVGLRDEIKELAAQRGESMPSIIEEMLELYLEEIRMKKLRAQVAATPPEDMAEYMREVDAMDRAYGS